MHSKYLIFVILTIYVSIPYAHAEKETVNERLIRVEESIKSLTQQIDLLRKDIDRRFDDSRKDLDALISMQKDDYVQRYNLVQGDLQKRMTVLSTVDQVGWFSITPQNGLGLQGPHFGVCDLSGDCQVSIA